jgi:hypothetical protein
LALGRFSKRERRKKKERRRVWWFGQISFEFLNNSNFGSRVGGG